MKKLHIALIGCGNWGRYILRDLISLGCDVSVITASLQGIENAKKFGAHKIYSDLKEVTTLDGAVVAVDTVYHYDVVKKILEHFPALPIFCEKPLCVNSSQAEELHRLAPGNLFVMDKWRYHKGVLELAKIIKSNELGPTYGIQFYRNGWGSAHDDMDSVWHLLPHDLAMCIELIGYLPKPQFAFWEKTSTQLHGMSGFLKSEKHWMSFQLSSRHPVHHREIIVYAENGIAKLNDAYSNTIEIYKTKEKDLKQKAKHESRPFENEMPLLSELSAFVDFLKGNSVAPKSSSYEGLLIVKHIEELRKLAGAI